MVRLGTREESRDEGQAQMNAADLEHLRSAIAPSLRSRESGNQPFGALLADPRGQVVIEAESTVVSESDCTGPIEVDGPALEEEALAVHQGFWDSRT
jgi:hypothetical protein